MASPWSYMMNTTDSKEDAKLKKCMEETYSQSILINQSFWLEADIDSRFKAGDESLWPQLYGDIPAFQRKMFSFNRIRRICNLITGFQRRNRKSTVCIPIEGADEETASQFTKTLMWMAQKEGMLETISQSFDGAITTGMNLLSLWVDFRGDPINGNIKLDNVSYNQYLIDPFFKKADLSDCNFIWTRKWVSKTQAKSLLPSKEDEIERLNAREARDGKFQFMPESYAFAMENELLTFDEFWYKSMRDQTLIVDVVTGASFEWRKDSKALKEYLDSNPQKTSVKRKIQTCRLGILLNGRVMYNGLNPMGLDRYPFIPVFGYYEPQISNFSLRLQGVVRGLRSSQALFSHRKRVELEILESQISSGFKYKENALVNPSDVFLSGTGKGLAIKENANLADVEKILPPEVPPSMLELSQLLGREIEEISGINEELLGSATDEKAGVLSMLRQGAGLTTLQILFDQLDNSQKLLGSLCIELIQKNFTPAKIERITNQVPTSQFFNKEFGTFDSAVEEGVNTTSQKQLNFRQLLELKQIGLPIPNRTLIEASTLQNKKELMEAIQADEETQQQLSQLQLQQALKEQEAKVADLTARGQANMGLAIERSSRSEENRALANERLARSDSDREMSFLHKVKALKELESMDLAKLEKTIQLFNLLKTESSAIQEEEKKEVKTPSLEEIATITKTPESTNV